MWITLIVLLLSAAFFIHGKVRSDLVALCALLALLLTNILTPKEGLAGFSNTTVIMMVGLFVVGGAIFKTGLAKMIGSKILQLAGTSELKLFLLVMLATSGIGAFVSNTGTVALMMPIIVSMAAAAGISARRLLMPLAFASSMGGMMTLIGTPPNLIVSDTLAEAGYGHLGFFTFLPVGIITVIVGTLYLLPATKLFLSPKKSEKDKIIKGKSLNDLVREYGITSNLFRVKVAAGSSAIGKTIIDMNIYKEYNVNVLELRRKSSGNRFVRTINQQLASPTLVLQKEDILYLSGELEKIQKLSEDYNLNLLDTHTNEVADKNGQSGASTSLDFYDIGVAELLIMSSSSMVNKSIVDLGLRSKFNINVLGIRRKKEYILHDLGSAKINEGDVLLVQGSWRDIARLRQESDNWVVLGEPLEEAAKVTLDHKAPIAALIMIGMVAVMAIDSIPVAPVTAVLTAAVLMVVTGCIRNMEAAYKTINWQTIVLFAAMLPMSTALEKTGVTELIADFIVTSFGASGPYMALGAIYFATSLMTIFISNTVTAVLMAPIGLAVALGIGVSPIPYMFAVTVAASMCFASPFSTPPNVLVMSAGQYTFMDYVKVGLPLQILIGIIMIFALPLLFPF